jgi:PAS domain S-box-containing protein
MSYGCVPVSFLPAGEALPNPVTSSAPGQPSLLAVADLHEALDRIADGVIFYSRDWRFLYLNRAAENYFRRPRAQLLGRIVWEEFPRTAGTEFERKLREAAERQTPSDMTIFTPTMERWVTVNVFPSASGISITFRDVTTSALAVQAGIELAVARHASEAQYRSLFDNALDGTLLTEPGGGVLAANEAACRMFGRSEAEICAVGRSGLVDVTDPRLAAAMEERRRTGRMRAEFTCVRKDGSRFLAEVCSTIFLDVDGRKRTSMTVRDLTEQKRGEDRLRLVAESGNTLGATLDMETTLQNLARLVVPRLADVAFVDLIEEGMLRRVAVAHRDPAREATVMGVGSLGPVIWKETGLYKVARTGEEEFIPVVDDDILRATTRDEEHLAIVRAMGPRSVIMVPLVGHSGVLGVLTLGIVDDARRYDRSDLAAARAIADRAGSAVDNARLYAQVVEAKRLRDQVLSIVSHDLRSPLNTMLLGARVIAQGAPAEGVSKVERAAKHADSLLKDLLTVAALEATPVLLEKEPHSLSSLVEEALEAHRHVAEERSIVLEASIDADVGAVDVDRRRILQVLDNLLGNALKFTGPTGRIRVEAQSAGEWAVVRVADTGPGIEPQSLPHVFDRFWQGARAKSAGAGLGLAIAKGFIDAHGGKITVESALGRGTTFTFTIPRAPG